MNFQFFTATLYRHVELCLYSMFNGYDIFLLAVFTPSSYHAIIILAPMNKNQQCTHV